MTPARIGAALAAGAAAAASGWALATTPADAPRAGGTVPAPMRVAAHAVLRDERFADPGLPSFDVVHASRPGGVRVLDAGGRRVARFTARPGDHLWDATDGAALALADRPAEGSTRRYAIVFRTGDVPVTGRWQALAKWSSSRRDGVPDVALMIDGGRLVLQRGRGPDGHAQVAPGPFVADGAWHAAIVRVTWAPGPRGGAEMVVDGRPPVTVSGATHGPGAPPDTLQLGYTRDAGIGGEAHVDVAQLVVAG